MSTLNSVEVLKLKDAIDTRGFENYCKDFRAIVMKQNGDCKECPLHCSGSYKSKTNDVHNFITSTGIQTICPIDVKSFKGKGTYAHKQHLENTYVFFINNIVWAFTDENARVINGALAITLPEGKQLATQEMVDDLVTSQCPELMESGKLKAHLVAKKAIPQYVVNKSADIKATTSEKAISEMADGVVDLLSEALKETLIDVGTDTTIDNLTLNITLNISNASVLTDRLKEISNEVENLLNFLSN